MGGSMTWYVVAHEDSHYPVVVYPRRDRAERIARKNGGIVVPVETPPGWQILDDRRRPIPEEKIL